MKKLIALLLVAALGLSTLAGCGGDGGSSSSGSSSAADSSQSSESQADEGDTATDGEPATVVMAMQTFVTVPALETTQTVVDEVNSFIKENYPDVNLELEWQLYGPADYAQRINLMMQSGEELDIFIPPSGIIEAINSNQLAPLTDAIDQYGKDMVDILTQYRGDDVFESVTRNGEIMAVPVNANMALTATLIYNQDMLDATGYTQDDITDLQSLEPIFAKIRELYPDVYPFASCDTGNGNLPYYWEPLYEIDELGNTFGVVFGDSGEVVNLFETQEWYDLITMMKKWYDNDWMPKDTATTTMMGTEYLSAGRAFCTYASFSSRREYESSGESYSNMYGMNMGAMPINEAYVTSNMNGAVLGVSSASDVVDEAVQLLNIMYTDEYVYNTLLWGLEGRDYVKVTDNTVTYPEGLDISTVPYNAFQTMGEWGTADLMWGLENGLSEEQKQLDHEFTMSAERNARHSPYYGFVFDGTDYVNELTALNNLYDQYAVPLMCGSVEIDSTLEAFNNALYEAGLQDIMDAKQEQLDAWLAERGE